MLNEIIKTAVNTAESAQNLFPFEEEWKSKDDICSKITMSIVLWGINHLVGAK